MTDCPSEDLLLELTSGRLEPAKAASLHEHIDACTSCLHVVAELLRSDSAPPSLYPARYRMIEESARGGQARVLRGYDSLTRREVAIKELLPQEAPSDKTLRRFVHEARLTASLTHPGIVPIFDIGFREDGQPFYTMQFVRGRTLAQVLRSSGSLAERLRYLSHFLELCQAVSFAHSRGVVHRDIKPQNVVVGEFGQTMLIDWGLAKLTRAAAEAAVDDGEVARAPDATMAGSVIGTPAYMSPEQASGRVQDVDERSDVFGLGAVLYELLTGRPPHAGSNVTQLLSAARTVAAAPVGPDAPRELAVIAHKALALDRADRYERAADVAADVQAYLTGDRVGAYDYSSWELLRRLVARHKRTVAAALLGVVALMAALAALAVALRREDQQRQRAEVSGAETMIEGAQSALAHRDVLAARARLRSALETTDSLEARSLWRELSVDPLLWQVNIGSQARAIALSPVARRFAVAGFLPGIRLIDIDTGVVEVLPTGQIASLAFSRDGRRITSVDMNGRAQRWDLATRRASELGDAAETVWTMVQSSDERTLYLVGSSGRLLRIDTATREVTAIPLSRPASYYVAIRPDGKELALGVEPGELRTLDLATGRETALPCRPGGRIVPAYSPDGTLLAAVGAGGKICLFSGTSAPPRIIDGTVIGALAFSPDGRRFAVGGADGRVRVWESASGRLVATLREGEAVNARAPTWTHDGRAVAVIHSDGAVRLYSTEMPPPEPGAGASPPGVLTSVAVSPDGDTIVTGGRDGRLRFHDLRSGIERLSFRAHQNMVLAVAYAPDGRVASGDSDGQVRIWDGERPLKTLAGPSPLVFALRFAGGGRLVSSGAGFHIWDLEKGSLTRSLAVPGANMVPAVAGEELALGHADGVLSRWDLATGRELERVSLAHESLDRIVYIDGGRGQAAVTAHGDVLLRDASGSVRTLGTLDCVPEGCLLAADAAGARLAVVQNHRRIAVWNLTSGQRTDISDDAFQAVTLTPDGKDVAGLSPHGILQVWDAETGRARWRGPLLREGSDEVYTHRGWRSLSGQPAAATTAWRRAVEAESQWATESGDLLCLATLDGQLEVWSEARDVRLARVDLPGITNLAADDRGCLVRVGTTVTRVDRQGKLEVLATDATAIYAAGGTILVGSEDRVAWRDGTERTEVVDPGLSAIGRTEAGELVVGYDHGAVQVRRAGGVLPLADTPSSQVLTVVAGAPGLVAAAFADGTIGLWSGATGQLLKRWWLHGPVRHLALRGSRLLAITDVGEVAAWEVGTFSITYCQLLRDVWRAVPVVWEGGRPALQHPPPGHRCATSP